MGLIRKSLFVASGGIVAPNSKKQRLAKQQLAALQGKSEAEVRRAGGRYEHVLWANLGQTGPTVPPEVVADRLVGIPDEAVVRLVDEGVTTVAAVAEALAISEDDARTKLCVLAERRDPVARQLLRQKVDLAGSFRRGYRQAGLALEARRAELERRVLAGEAFNPASGQAAGESATA